MALISDFSNWHGALFKYALDLMLNENIFEFDENSKEFKFSDDYKEKQKNLIQNKIRVHLFWLGFSAGLESLVKAVLLKHESMNIENRNLDGKYTDVGSDYYKAIHGALIFKLQVEDNEWLKNQLEEKGITSIYNINTPTLGSIIVRELVKLEQKGVITNDELIILQKSFAVFKDIRRNVDSHIFLKIRTAGSINKDIDNIYLPLINLLINIYCR